MTTSRDGGWTPQRRVLFLCAIVALDMMGIGLVFPVLGPLMASGQLLAAGTDSTTRDLLYGLALGAPSVVMLLASPLLGDASDLHGRKRWLVVSLAILMTGFATSGVAILLGSYWLFFAGRIANGIAGASQSIAKAAIADVSDAQTKVVNMGRMTLASGAGLVGGAVVGALLSHPDWLGYATPYLALACVSAGFAVACAWRYPREPVSAASGVRAGVSVGRVFEVLRGPQVARLASAFFGLLCVWGLFTQFLPLAAVDRHAMSSERLGGLMLVIGAGLAVGTELLLRPLTRRFSRSTVAATGIGAMAAGIAWFAVGSDQAAVWGSVAVAAVGMGLGYACAFALLSDAVAADEQGKIMGAADALSAAAMAVTGLLGAAAYTASWWAPFAAAITCAAVAGGVMVLRAE